MQKYAKTLRTDFYVYKNLKSLENFEYWIAKTKNFNFRKFFYLFF